MREILFRGKRINNGEWVYGYYVPVCFGKFPCKQAIVPEPDGVWEPIAVKPETVDQFTGLTDKNGKKIFEDDIIRVKCSIRCPIGVGNSFRIGTYDIDYIASVIFDDCRFCLAKANGEIYEIPLSSENIEVIGNIHDNPELLEE